MGTPSHDCNDALIDNGRNPFEIAAVSDLLNGYPEESRPKSKSRATLH